MNYLQRYSEVRSMFYEYSQEIKDTHIGLLSYIYLHFPERQRGELGSWSLIDWQEIITNDPLLGFRSKQAFVPYKSFLEDIGLLEQCPMNKNIGKAYYRLSDVCKSILAGEDKTEIQIPSKASERILLETEPAKINGHSFMTNSNELPVNHDEVMTNSNELLTDANELLTNTNELLNGNHVLGKGKKGSAKNIGRNKKAKTVHPCFGAIRESFEDFYLNKIHEPYNWSPKNAIATNSLIRKMQRSIEAKPLADGEMRNINNEIIRAFKLILDELPEWYVDNLDLATINAKYDSIVSNIKAKYSKKPKINGNHKNYVSDHEFEAIV